MKRNMAAGRRAAGARRRGRGAEPNAAAGGAAAKQTDGGLSVSPAVIEHNAQPGALATMTVANRSAAPLAITVTPRPWVQDAAGKVSPNRKRRWPASASARRSSRSRPAPQQDVTSASPRRPSAGCAVRRARGRRPADRRRHPQGPRARLPRADHGRRPDHGRRHRRAASASDLFYVTTTSTGSESVCEWFEWWNAVWGYDVEIINVTGSLTAVNVAGPQARGRCSGSRTTTSRTTRCATSTPGRSGSPACRASRCASASSASSATSSTTPRAPASTSGTRSSRRALVPFGLEPQRILRLEKGHVIVGQDTDSESNLLAAGHVRGSPSSTRTTSSASGRSSTSGARVAGAARRLHAAGGRAAAGGSAGRPRRPAGRPRHERTRERAARQGDRPRLGPARPGRGGRDDRDPRSTAPARAGDRDACAVLRPEGRAAAVVSGLAFLSPDAARRRRLRARLAARARRRGAA